MPRTSPPIWMAATAAAVLATSAPAQQIAPAAQPTQPTDYFAIGSPTLAPELMTVRVLSEFPHDPHAYTQGLVLDGDMLLESTGLYGKSQLREVDLVSGTVLRANDLPAAHFGEGLAHVDNRLIQLTWRENVAHIWDRQTFEKIGEFSYIDEGWGLVHDGTHLVMTDGSDRLQFRNPETFELIRQVNVRVNGEPVRNLNELEWAEGLVWANVWMQDFIVAIDPANGQVRRLVDARPLRQLLTSTPGAPNPEVLNGIAYNEAEGTYYVTGKYWPKLFEVQFIPATE